MANISLNWLELVTHFITRATPMYYIDCIGYNLTEKQQKWPIIKSPNHAISYLIMASRVDTHIYTNIHTSRLQEPVSA